MSQITFLQQLRQESLVKIARHCDEIEKLKKGLFHINKLLELNGVIVNDKKTIKDSVHQLIIDHPGCNLKFIMSALPQSGFNTVNSSIRRLKVKSTAKRENIMEIWPSNRTYLKIYPDMRIEEYPSIRTARKRMKEVLHDSGVTKVEIIDAMTGKIKNQRVKWNKNF